jgi:TonB-linked SusC/RagA family outer membrane protein
MKKFLLLSFSLAIAVSVWAQERTVSGRVTSAEDGTPLPGVNVVLKGTSTGTATDADGSYRMTIPQSGGSLTFSFIGLQSQEVNIGDRTVVDVTLRLDVAQLGEVVVTAVGIERDKKALGYSVAGVGAEKISQLSEVDPLRALQGKMPGVNIVGGGGAPGQSTKINIRGASSLTGNTQPLFIVDGIPFDNSVNASGGSSSNTVFSNRAFDIDPNNIESITVLKGAAAAALYGSRATNGVVVITTKSGKTKVRKGMEVTYSGSLNFTEIAGVPTYQDVYTQGSNQVYNGSFIGNWGSPFPNHVDRINAEFGTDYVKYYGTYVGGPKAGQPYPDGTAPHPLTANSFSVNLGSRSLFPELMDADGYPVPYDIKPYDVMKFFTTGQQVENSLNISSGTDKSSINAGFSRMKQEGFVPNQEASRTSLYFGGNSQLDNGLFLSGNVNYVNTQQQSPQSAGSAFADYYGGEGTSSIYARLFYLPRNYDLMGLPFESPVDGSNMFYRALDNPRWIAKHNLYTSDVNRVYGNITAKYDVTPWLELLVKGGVNTYSEARRSINRPGGSAFPLGRLWTEDLTNTEIDLNYIATISKDINEDLSIRALLGFNNNERSLSRRRVTGNQIIQAGLYLTNATSQQQVNYDFSRLRRLYGAYFDVSFSYKDYLFLNVVGRNDWSSTLPEANNSYFYPGASVSFIFTDALTLNTNILNSGKIRVAATKVGNDADPYLTFTNFAIVTPYTTPAGTFTNRGTLADLLGNPELKPEFTTEYEVGTDLRFFNNKLGLDITYFNRQSTNQIARASMTRSTGFSQEVVNVGRLDNRGWEIGVDITPVSTASGFTWNSYVAFTRIRTEVVDAGPTGEIFIGGAASTFGTIHRAGQPYGQIFGTRNARDDEGNLLIDKDTGLPFSAPTSAIIGNPNPDFILGWTNTFSYKGFTLSALLDWKQGGDFYSFTGASLLLRGMLGFSADREALRVVPGVYGDPQTYQPVLDDGNNKIRNTTPVTSFDTHFSNGWGAYGQDEVNVYDGTVIRLREISLGYTIPKAILSKTPFGSARVSVSGRNLWWNAPNVLPDLNLDPEFLTEAADSNIQGFEYGATPASKRYGVNVVLTF